MPIGSSLGITLPTQGANSNTWGTDLNNELNKIITAVEAQVPASAIDFSSDFSLNNNSLTSVKATTYAQQATAPTALNSSWFDDSGNFYLRDGANNPIQVTASGALNNASAGGLGDSGGNYGTSNITLDWNGVQYDLHDGAGSYAPMRCGAITVDDNITLDSSAEIKHGNRVLSIPAIAGAGHTNAGVLVPFSTGINDYDGKWTGGSNDNFTLPIPLLVGDRIISVKVFYTGTDGSGKLLRLCKGTSTRTLNASTSGTSATYANETITASSATIAAGENWWVEFVPNGATASIHHIEVTYDRP